MSIQWHSGPPPSVGWWPASHDRNSDRLRWWNGKNWSTVVYASASADEAANIARLPARMSLRHIEWCDRPADWPERSRT
jgi:hypothetical protein